MTIFPFLKIARDHGVSYRQIMQEVRACERAISLAEETQCWADIQWSMTLASPLRDRQRAIFAAIEVERCRRNNAQVGM